MAARHFLRSVFDAGHGHVTRYIAYDGRTDGIAAVLVFAILSAESGRAFALEAAAAVITRAAVSARLVTTLVHVDAAILSAKPGSTFALIIVHQILASTAVGARFRQTIVHLFLAMLAHVSGHAMAPIAIHQVHARAAVPARITGTVVDIGLAILTGEAARATALVAGVLRQRCTVSAILARIRRAMRYHRLAIGAAVAGRAGTFVTVNGVATRAAVFAGSRFARLYGDLAVRTVPSFRTFALVTGAVLLQRTNVKSKNQTR